MSDRRRTRYPTIKAVGRDYRLTWKDSTLKLVVNPVGDAAADIEVSGAGCDDVWFLGETFRRLAVWADDELAPIDAALADREKVLDGAVSADGVRVISTEKVRGGRKILFSEEFESCDIEVEMTLKSLGHGLRLGVKVSGCPTPGIFQAMGEVLQHAFESSRVDGLGYFPGNQVENICGWAWRRWGSVA